MIIEEKNQPKELRKKIEKIKSLWNIILPENYFLICEENTDIRIEYRTWCFLANYKVATIDIEDDVLIVSFEDEEEYKKLRSCFEDSNTKFKLVVGEKAYY